MQAAQAHALNCTAKKDPQLLGIEAALGGQATALTVIILA